MALLSSESLGASLENFHDALVPSLNSKTGRGRGDLGLASGDDGVRISGAGDRSSVNGGVCFDRSGDGAVLFSGCFSNSLDISGDLVVDSGSGDATTA